MNVADCERKDKFSVEKSDASASLPSGGVDNDFHCPVTGRWVALKLVNGQMWCADKDCQYLADLTMTIPPSVFE